VVAPPGPSHSSARRVDALPLLSGGLPTEIFLSRILPTLSIGGSAIATSRFLHLPAEASESRDPIFLVNADFPRRFGTSRYRDFWPISSGSPVPRPEDAEMLTTRSLAFRWLATHETNLWARQPPRSDVPRSLFTSTTLVHAMHVIPATSAPAFSRLFRSTYPVRPAKHRYARYPSRIMIFEVLPCNFKLSILFLYEEISALPPFPYATSPGSLL
jgi:hypothetical protein